MKTSLFTFFLLFLLLFFSSSFPSLFLLFFPLSSQSDHRPVSALFRVRSKPPYLGPAPKTLEMSIHDTDLTISILDLTYEYEAPTGDDVEENDIDEPPGTDGNVSYEGTGHKFDNGGDGGGGGGGGGGDSIGSSSRESSMKSSMKTINKPREVIRKRGHRNSVMNPDLKLFAQQFRVRSWLEKKKKKGLFKKGYQKRWFELDAHYIVYKKGEDEPVLAAIDVRGVDSCVVENSEEFRFTLNLGGVVPRKYPLRASDQETLDMWVTAINKRLGEYRQEEQEKKKFSGLGNSFKGGGGGGGDGSLDGDRDGDDDDEKRGAGPSSPASSSSSSATTGKSDDAKPLTTDSLQVRFVGSFLSVANTVKKNSNETLPVQPRENSNQVSGMLPLLIKEVEGGEMMAHLDDGNTSSSKVGRNAPEGSHHHDNGTSSVNSNQLFDETFEVFVDGAETRRERNTSYTMYTVRCRAMRNVEGQGDEEGMLIEEPIEVIVMRRYSDFRKMNDIVKTVSFFSFFFFLHSFVLMTLCHGTGILFF